MGADRTFRAGTAVGRRAEKAAFYRVVANGVFELGEIARIEIEIQKLFPPASPQPRCPNWHHPAPVQWPPSLHSH